MLKRIREPFGTAGLVVAIVALIFALTGGAFAADHYLGASASKKQTAKRGPKGAKGDTGAPGPVGPKGDAGANGANGSNGANGADGQSVTSVAEPAGANCAAGGYKLTSASGTQYVCNGKDGEGGGGGGEAVLPETLPSEQSETGVWSINKPEKTAGPIALFAQISFPVPLDDKLGEANVHYIDQEGKEQGEPSEHCHGSVEVPLADPGHLCVYEGLARGDNLLSTPSNEGIFQPIPSSQIGAGRTGALLTVLFTADSTLAEAYGSWAVTAP